VSFKTSFSKLATRNVLDGMALPCFSGPDSAHNERQHASVLQKLLPHPKNVWRGASALEWEPSLF
jgi:hypothetical protein